MARRNENPCVAGCLWDLKFQVPNTYGYDGDENDLSTAAAHGDLAGMQRARAAHQPWLATLINAAGRLRARSTPQWLRLAGDVNRLLLRRQRSHRLPPVGSGQRLPV